ncbi:MAG TPA: 16S rRNA (cytidine(1402)-2'-O)-methyltransferase [Solirubrobacteraceae bacterium]|jgi:16S rRNA (cytidine1402-2'-O)-methyltransferase|nr:16S rRNA (cytidine(1402)-2'-O)-methyltransferase [Solirubrobacteraceae bacterium]
MTRTEAPVGRLLVCPTPIGNLEDVTLRVLQALAAADVVACEDTRHTRVLLERYAISAHLVSFHEHNERARAADLVKRIAAGEVVALVSDAGMPLVSDPGHELVRACLEVGLEVEVLPGPSAVMTALVASGLPAERWRFVGFLPRTRGELERMLGETPETLVAFESPRRLAATLALLAERDPTRPVAICRELTKLHEEVRRGSAAELAAAYRETQPRGEMVLVCGAAPAGQVDRGQALEALRELIAAGAKTRPAAAAVAKLTGLGANELYRELLSEETRAGTPPLA